MAAGAALALVAIAAAVWVLALKTEPVQPGPLDVGGGDSVSAHFAPGQTGSASWIEVVNFGDQPAVLEAIEPVGMSPGMTVPKIYASGVDRSSAGGCCTQSWPPKTKYERESSIASGELHDPRGVKVPPTATLPEGPIAGVMLTVLLRAEQPGTYGFRGLAVTYTAGGQRYRRVITNAMTMCVAERFTRCDAIRTYTPLEAAAEAKQL